MRLSCNTDQCLSGNKDFLFLVDDRLAAFSSSTNNGATPVRVMSPWYNVSTEGDGRCLKFRYMQLGKGKTTLILYQRNNIFPKERPIWEVQSTDETAWQYGQVSVSGVTEHQVTEFY